MEDEDPQIFIWVWPQEESKASRLPTEGCGSSVVWAMEGWEALKDGPVDWDVFKEAFLCRFFPLELREKKIVEIMNIRQGEWVWKSTLSNSPNSIVYPGNGSHT